MAQDTLNATEEETLLQAIKRAVDLTEQGLTPDEAIEKIAREESFGPGKIQTISHAYNTGKQLSQWQKKGSILDKLASYPLVDPDKVIARIYQAKPEAEKAAQVHSEYQFPPGWLPSQTKLASAPLPQIGAPFIPEPPEVLPSLHKAYGLVQRHKQATDELSRQASQAEDLVRTKVASLVTYFKHASYNRLPFDVVESAAHNYYGNPAVALLDIVYQQGRLREKRAGVTPPLLTRPLDLHTEPFSLIQTCIKAAQDCRRHQQALQVGLEKAAMAKEEAFRPFSQADSSQPRKQASILVLSSPEETQAASLFDVSASKRAGWNTEVAAIAAGDMLATKAMEHPEKKENDPYGDISDIENETSHIDHAANKAIQHKKKELKKQAFLSGPAMGAMGAVMGRTLGQTPKTKDDLVEDAWMDFEDPEHQNELRKIRAHAMLNQLLTDPDDPISGHDHDRVLRAYNEINQVAPRIAENIATLRPHLRRRLEGHQEPFEVKELADTEKGLSQTKSPTPNTNLLNETPDKILG